MPPRLHTNPRRLWIPAGFRLCLVVCWLTFAASGCSDSPVRRNSTQEVNVDGQPALRIECEYVGKQPGDPSSYVSKHDFRKRDTDFYRITIENLTDKDVAIERVEYRLARGPMRGRDSASADSIRRTWGTNIVPANSQISRANNMVWSGSSRNTLFKTYFFNIEGSHDLIPAEIPLVYQR
jgi:hypothetical protein